MQEIKKIRILIVDDSSYARYVIKRHLQNDPGIEVIAEAADGIDALDKVTKLRPDVVTLDVEMPRLDGIATLERIMNICPTPVVMLSTLTAEGAETTVKALGLGAVDFFPKSSPSSPTGTQVAISELIIKIKAAAQVKVSRVIETPIFRREKPEKPVPPSHLLTADFAVVIGSSTGGPRALYQIIPALKADIPAAILVIQHMPVGFTRALANRLNELSDVSVKEAEAGDVLRHGEVLVAPGGYHMLVSRKRTIEINQGPPICGVRPSVDATMRSVSPVFRSKCMGVVLTGMGCDGTAGAGVIKGAGGHVLVEDESTATIYGMPKCVAEAGHADCIAPLDRIPQEIMRMLKERMKVAV